MHVDRMTMAYGRIALQEAARKLLSAPNVNLIDFGHPEHDGEIAENELALRVHVDEKLSGLALESAIEAGVTRPIPASIGGFPVDIPQGKYRPHQWWGWWSGWWQPPITNPRAIRADPLRGGISISDERHNSYGTLGGLVIDRDTGEEMILSNWHVLAADWIARPGQRIVQAGRLDGGTLADTVATLTRDAMSVSMDAAVATLNGSRLLLNDQLDLGPVQGVGRAQLGMELVKSGRRTDITRGRVTAVEGIAKINYSGLDRIIRNVVTIEPRWFGEEVSAPGDSGSWWLDRDTMRAVGLHFAGGNQPERGLAIDMLSVLDALNVDVVTESQPERARTAVLRQQPHLLVTA